MTVFRCTAAYEFSCGERMYGFQCSAISGQRDTACVDPGMWCTVTPARRALSLPQAQELLFAQKHGALYNVQNSCMHTRMPRSLRMHGSMDVNSCWCQRWREVFIYGRLCWIIQVLHAQQPQGVFPGENSIGFRKRKKKS